jgi:hypothetical protein
MVRQQRKRERRFSLLIRSLLRGPIKPRSCWPSQLQSLISWRRHHPPVPVLAPLGVGTLATPASLGQSLRATLFASGDPFVELEVSVPQVSRGAAAEQSLGSVLTLINPAPDGEEYLYARVRVAFLENPAFNPVTVGLESFRLSTADGNRQPVASSRPDPSYPQSVLPGIVVEGWLAFLVPANDPAPTLGLIGATFSVCSRACLAEGPGGLWGKDERRQTFRSEASPGSSVALSS